jgi:hypothetical protein
MALTSKDPEAVRAYLEKARSLLLEPEWSDILNCLQEIVPTLYNGLTAMCKKMPEDPYTWLAYWCALPASPRCHVPSLVHDQVCWALPG